MEFPLPKPRHIPELFLAIDTISSNLADILSPTLWILCPWDNNHFNFDCLSKRNSLLDRGLNTRGITIYPTCQQWFEGVSSKPLQLDYCHSVSLWKCFSH